MEPTESYVIFPRKIGSDFRNGRISKPELIIYYWLRQNGDPYGVVRMGIPELADFYPNKVTDNFINRILLSLKSKRYIYYERRTGRRGSFEIHMGDWILPKGAGVKTLDRFFITPVRPTEPPKATSQSDAKPDSEPLSQSYLALKKDMAERFKMPPGVE